MQMLSEQPFHHTDLSVVDHTLPSSLVRSGVVIFQGSSIHMQDTIVQESLAVMIMMWAGFALRPNISQTGRLSLRRSWPASDIFDDLNGLWSRSHYGRCLYTECCAAVTGSTAALSLKKPELRVVVVCGCDAHWQALQIGYRMRSEHCDGVLYRYMA